MTRSAMPDGDEPTGGDEACGGEPQVASGQPEGRDEIARGCAARACHDVHDAVKKRACGLEGYAVPLMARANALALGQRVHG